MRCVVSRRGQSIIEWAVVFVAIVSVLIVGVNRALRTQTCQIYQDMGNRMDQSTQNLETKFGRGVSFPTNTP